MTWKTIEAAREIRQWTTQIVIPTVAVGVAIAVTPELREPIVDAYRDVKEKLNQKYVESNAKSLSLRTWALSFYARVQNIHLYE